jgi:catechol 2,3-dioxygenase-like lactoylglutathione lyase family enzyme
MASDRRMRLTGVHHLTVICADLARTTAFYRDVLGLAVVHEGVSDDDPDARHHWFSAGGDGAPGTLISFLEYSSLPAGTVGIGSTQHFALTVESADEQLAWRDYLRSRGVQCTEVFDRGLFRSLYFRDPDGHIVEIATRGPGFTGAAEARAGAAGSAPDPPSVS